MNAKPKRHPPNRGKPLRNSRQRPEKSTILIVCEGRETERNYLDSLKREERVCEKFAITVVKGRGGSRRQIVQHAVDQKNNRNQDFDAVWCVMDVEHLDTQESRDDLAAAILNANHHQISLYLSNPTFEVWLLAHFIRSSLQFNDCNAVIEELNKHWKIHFHIEYDKSDRRLYDKLITRMRAAIDNAKEVREQDHPNQTDIIDCNSATEFYKVLEYFQIF